jgi:integrase
LLLRQARLPDIRFHDLRHTCATLLLTKGIHPKIVSEMLRHSSIAITLDTYSHVIPGLGEVAASAMEDALR